MDLQNLRIALFDALKPYGDEEGHDMRMNQTKHAHVLIQSLMAFLHTLKKTMKSVRQASASSH